MTILDGIPFLNSPNHASRNGVKITDIVLHWMDGTLAGADARFADAAEEVSAHYGIEDATIHQYVALPETAWQSGDKPENQRSIGIEHSADPKRPASAQTVATSVALITALCRKYSIDPSHIYPHKKFYPTQCPGTLPIADIVARVRAQLATPTTPTPEVDMPVTPAEMDAIAIKAAEQVWQRFKVRGIASELATLQTALTRILAASDKTLAAASPVTTTGGAPIDVAAIAKAVADEQARRLVA